MFKKILALSPHTDDIELGCGGTLKKFKEKGSDIHIVNFALAKPLKEGDVYDEFKQSMKLIDSKYDMLGYKVRSLNLHRQEILDYLYKLQNKEKFDLVLCHSTHDIHQDHETVTKEALRAFRNTSIFGYELPWNCLKFSTDVFVGLDKKHLEFKRKLLDCYKSQLDRSFMTKEYIYDIARTRGLQCGKKYAESFENIRTIL